MIASDLISTSVLPLKTSDTGKAALTVMGDFYVKHLPIVNNTQLLAVISEEDVINNPMNEPVGSYDLGNHRPYVSHREHFFDIMGTMAENDLTVIPVVDDDGNYMGMITQSDLLSFYAKSFSFTEPGGILVLEVRKRDYSLAEISRIVESENGAILSSFISNSPNTNIVFVTLKIAKVELQKIQATLERFDYTIKASFMETEYMDTLKDRYDLLMNYLDV